MFLEKLEDLAYFNRIMRDTPELEPYFAELAVWCWIYQREKYLEVVKEYEEQLQNGTIEKVNSALEKMEIEKYEAHWAQANCPIDTEIRRYRHHASSSKLLLRSIMGVLHFPACRVEFLSKCIKSFNLASTFTLNGAVIHIFARE